MQNEIVRFSSTLPEDLLTLILHVSELVGVSPDEYMCKALRAYTTSELHALESKVKIIS